MGIRLVDSLPRLRRFLRDPDGAIWDNAAIVRFWNRAQIDLAEKAKIHLAAEAFRYPSVYNFAYSYGWERGFLEGDLTQFGTVMRQQAGTVTTYSWEVGSALNVAVPHSGNAYSQPWESVYGAPADVLPVKVHSRIIKPIVVAYDEVVLEATEIQRLSRQDPYWRTRKGTPACWYWWDQTRTSIGLYPNPTASISETEIGDILSDTGGIVLFTDTGSETNPSGLVTEEVALTDNLFVAYVPFPAQISSVSDETDWPEYCRHYLECHVLYQAFGADTDGFIPSLRDYWKSRYDMGVEILKGLKYKRLKDAVITMGRGQVANRPGEPRLPFTYDDTATTGNAGYWAAFYWA